MQQDPTGQSLITLSLRERPARLRSDGETQRGFLLKFQSSPPRHHDGSTRWIGEFKRGSTAPFARPVQRRGAVKTTACAHINPPRAPEARENGKMSPGSLSALQCSGFGRSSSPALRSSCNAREGGSSLINPSSPGAHTREQEGKTRANPPLRTPTRPPHDSTSSPPNGAAGNACPHPPRAESNATSSPSNAFSLASPPSPTPSSAAHRPSLPSPSTARAPARPPRNSRLLPSSPLVLDRELLLLLRWRAGLSW